MHNETNPTDAFLQKINALTTTEPPAAFTDQLTSFINQLLQQDFEKLIYLLYRLDINERTLKKVLQDNPGTDAAVSIGTLIIKRQQEKWKTRMQFKQDRDIPEEDRW